MSKLRIYCGTVAWGWLVFGIGWRDKWFLGFSMSKGESHED